MAACFNKISTVRMGSREPYLAPLMCTDEGGAKQGWPSTGSPERHCSSSLSANEIIVSLVHVFAAPLPFLLLRTFALVATSAASAHVCLAPVGSGGRKRERVRRRGHRLPFGYFWCRHQKPRGRQSVAGSTPCTTQPPSLGPPSSYPFSKGLQPCSARTGLDGEAGKQPSEECDESSGWVVGVSRALLPARRSALLTSAGHLYPDVMAIRLL